jgi:hypothetical protein
MKFETLRSGGPIGTTAKNPYPRSMMSINERYEVRDIGEKFGLTPRPAVYDTETGQQWAFIRLTATTSPTRGCSNLQLPPPDPDIVLLLLSAESGSW